MKIFKSILDYNNYLNRDSLSENLETFFSISINAHNLFNQLKAFFSNHFNTMY